MTKRYREIMDKIEVTEEMRERILNNIQGNSIVETSQPKGKKVQYLKKYLSLAACFAILLAGVLAVPRLLADEGGDTIFINPDIIEVSSAEELSGEVGFEISELNDLPFVSERQTYTAFGREMAQIIYEGGGQSAVFRKSIGKEDNSGDYNSYPETVEISAGDSEVTLRGADALYTLAVWNDNRYSYSIQLSQGLSVEEWKTVIEGVN